MTNKTKTRWEMIKRFKFVFDCWLDIYHSKFLYDNDTISFVSYDLNPLAAFDYLNVLNYSSFVLVSTHIYSWEPASFCGQLSRNVSPNKKIILVVFVQLPMAQNAGRPPSNSYIIAVGNSLLKLWTLFVTNAFRHLRSYNPTFRDNVSVPSSRVKIPSRKESL
jgi:hypothetical protein